MYSCPDYKTSVLRIETFQIVTSRATLVSFLQNTSAGTVKGFSSRHASYLVRHAYYVPNKFLWGLEYLVRACKTHPINL